MHVALYVGKLNISILEYVQIYQKLREYLITL